MPFKTFTVGEVLSAGDVNTYLMRQVTAIVTSTTRPTSPIFGQRIFETDTGYTRIWNGSAWVLWPPTPVTADDASNYTTGSTTYQAGSTNLGVSFTAFGPRAVITVGGLIAGNSDGAAAILSFQLFQTNSSGSLVIDGAVANAWQVSGERAMRGSNRTLVDGLTTGQAYYVRTVHATSNASSVITIAHRRLIVEPCAN